MSSRELGRWLRIAEGILDCPTATGHEHAPAAFIRKFVEERKGLSLTEDRFGNQIVKWPGTRSLKSPPLVLMAHTDHPAFVVRGVKRGFAELEFRGGVLKAHAKRGTRVDFFVPGERVPSGRGEIVSTKASDSRGASRLGGARARIVSGSAPEPGIAMWSFPAYRLSGKKIVSRCLDDLLGVAAALATLDEMVRRKPRGAHVWGLFTRAEEVGFLGAIAAIRGKVIPRNARVLSLETSSALPHAPVGGGVIVRVGDAMSLFEPRLMGALHDVAKELAKEDSSFRFQRRLMDGGMCEATPYCAAGYRAGGIAVPLGNYHNMKGLHGGPKSMGAEFVHVNDYESEIRLLVRLAESSGSLAKLEGRTDAWLKPLEKKAVELLTKEKLPRQGKGS